MLKVTSLLVLKILFVSSVTCDEYEDKIKFVLFNNGNSSVSTFNTSMSQQGCDMNGNFSIVTHGWLGSSSPWIRDLINNLSQYRHGCIVFMNYSYYSDRGNYLEVITHFIPISNLLARKMRQINDNGASSDNIFMFGHSFGGRIVVEAGLLFGLDRIGQIDSWEKYYLTVTSCLILKRFSACDMAGPGFDFIYKKDPKRAAKNVQCIHTSINLGTMERKCHQDWLMGHCGITQDAGHDVGAAICLVTRNCPPAIITNHSLCPIFYNAAFKNDFKANTRMNCASNRMAKNLPADFKMGFMETRKKWVPKLISLNGSLSCSSARQIMFFDRHISVIFQFIDRRRYSRSNIAKLSIHKTLSINKESICIKSCRTYLYTFEN